MHEGLIAIALICGFLRASRLSVPRLCLPYKIKKPRKRLRGSRSAETINAD
jgi:hypothetical protein